MRKQYGLMFPENLIEAVDGFCQENNTKRTAFVEAAIREKMKREGIPIPPTDSGWRWNGEVDDMPFEI